MSAEQASRVFERFYRTDRARSRASGGTGLGLSIVAALVAAHGGTVTVDTAPGRGAAFGVQLPLAAAGPGPVMARNRARTIPSRWFRACPPAMAAAGNVRAAERLDFPQNAPMDLTFPVPDTSTWPDNIEPWEATMSVTHTTTDSPVGELTLVARDGRLTGVYFPHHWYRPDPATFGDRDEAGFGEAERQLAEYFAGDRERFDLPLDPRGDVFQQRVWELISRDPATGRRPATATWPSELGDGTLAKDVGAAVGRNPLSVIVPCHRVVGNDGSLTGYAGGLARKRFLLDLEEPAAAGFWEAVLTGRA